MLFAVFALWRHSLTFKVYCKLIRAASKIICKLFYPFFPLFLDAVVPFCSENFVGDIEPELGDCLLTPFIYLL